MLKKYIHTIGLGICMVAALSCEIGDQVDPNSPSLGSFQSEALPSQLNNLVTGTVSNMRSDLDNFYDDVGIVGREYYRFSGSDPRFTSDLLGQGGGMLDNNAFYVTRPYTERYQTIKNANILIEATNNTNQVTEEEKQAYLGFARTIQAHQLLMVLNLQNENGIRVDVEDPNNLGPFVSRDDALTRIASLLDSGDTHLSNAVEELPFPLSDGFEGFETASTFRQFNRGLAARVAVYRELYGDALGYLDESFMDLEGDLTTGTYYAFQQGGGDRINPIFIAPNASGDIRVAHPDWVEEAEAGDTRVTEKTAIRDVVAEQADLSSPYDVTVYTSIESPISIIRNEELILLYAEANIQEGNLAEGVQALDIIREAAGLNPLLVAKPSVILSQDALIEEMLNQRRYSLFYEGHRWVDMRRYDMLDELPIDRPGDIVHESFPIPFDEINFEENRGN
ncbi:RagB/SusD family nutrient uptake outer membrane protein [Limibacter armeniacum]|uniref:RagB/SusD family nutrient uptake outer membrane protein n=1 Tax=Limibacter armeniacum TaxID=466084 RepID=UPI002FE6AE8C